MKYKITPIGFSLILILILITTGLLAVVLRQPHTEFLKQLKFYSDGFQGSFSLKTEGDIINIQKKNITADFNYSDSIQVETKNETVLFLEDELIYHNAYLKYYDLYQINTNWLHLDETIAIVHNNSLPKNLIKDYNTVLSNTIKPYFKNGIITLDLKSFFNLVSQVNNTFKNNQLYHKWLLTYVSHYYDTYDKSIYDQATHLMNWQSNPVETLDQLIAIIENSFTNRYTDQSVITITALDDLEIKGILFYRHCDASEHFHLSFRPTDLINTVPKDLSSMSKSTLKELISLLDINE